LLYHEHGHAPDVADLYYWDVTAIGGTIRSTSTDIEVPASGL
jgi:hypothetical protein